MDNHKKIIKKALLNIVGYCDIYNVEHVWIKIYEKGISCGYYEEYFVDNNQITIFENGEIDDNSIRVLEIFSSKGLLELFDANGVEDLVDFLLVRHTELKKEITKNEIPK